MKQEDYIFISYAHARRPLIRAVAEQLSEHGESVWYDRDLADHTLWSAELVEHIESARLVVLILDRFSMDSRHVLAEVQHAFTNRIPIVTIQLESVDPPSALRYFIGSDQFATADVDATSITDTILRLSGKARAVRPKLSWLSYIFLSPFVLWTNGVRGTAILNAFMIGSYWLMCLSMLSAIGSMAFITLLVFAIPIWIVFTLLAKNSARNGGNRAWTQHHVDEVVAKANRVAPRVGGLVLCSLIGIAIVFPPKSDASQSAGRASTYEFAIESPMSRLAIGEVPSKTLLEHAELRNRTANSYIAIIRANNEDMGLFVRDGKLRVVAVTYHEGQSSPWKLSTTVGGTTRKLDLANVLSDRTLSKFDRVTLLDEYMEDRDVAVNYSRLRPSSKRDMADILVTGTTQLYNAKRSLVASEVQILALAESLAVSRDIGYLLSTVSFENLLRGKQPTGGNE